MMQLYVMTYIQIMDVIAIVIRGGSRLLKRGGTTRTVIIVDVGLVSIFTLIVCEACQH